MSTGSNNAQDHPGVFAWMCFVFFSALYPTIIFLLGTVAVNGKPTDVEVWLRMLLSPEFVGLLPVIGFAILLATCGDLIFERFYPGYWRIFALLVVGSCLTAIIGIGAFKRADAVASGQLGSIEADWVAVEGAIAAFVAFACALSKSEQLNRSVIEDIMAETEAG